MSKTYESVKTANVIYKCKACKRAVRKQYTVENKSIDNEHPESYLRATRSYRRIAGGHFIEARYFNFPLVNCPACAKPLCGKAIEGYLNPQHPCDSRCTSATGHNCECSCGGANHGIDHA